MASPHSAGHIEDINQSFIPNTSKYEDWRILCGSAFVNPFGTSVELLTPSLSGCPASTCNVLSFYPNFLAEIEVCELKGQANSNPKPSEKSCWTRTKTYQ